MSYLWKQTTRSVLSKSYVHAPYGPFIADFGIRTEFMDPFVVRYQSLKILVPGNLPHNAMIKSY